MTLAATLTQPLASYDDACAWYGPAMAARSDWAHTLSADDVAELDRAVAGVIDSNIDLVALTAEQFPLPTLAPKLRQVRQQLLHGCAIALLRGWPSTERSLRQSATAFYGIGTHLGEPISQNGLGHVLGHVANLGKDYKDPTTRGYQTKAELRRHRRPAVHSARPVGRPIARRQLDHRVERDGASSTRSGRTVEGGLLVLARG